MKNKIGKGDFGYFRYARRKQLIQTILLFGVSLSLFLGGYLMVHSKANLLTLVAVLGMLPASKSLVELIMFLKATGCKESDYELIKPHEGDLLVLYDLYFTSEKKNYPVSAMILKGKTICYYMPASDALCKACESHLEGIFRQNRFEGYTLKCFSKLDKFLDRMDSLDQLEMEKPELDAFVLETILNVSL